MTDDTVAAGVVGVGSMGRNHARVYADLDGVDLVGVTDVDEQAAERVAEQHDTAARSRDDLLAAADVVSVAVPTQFHYETARAALTADTDVLVEKPFVADPAKGRELIDLADRRDRVLQVGHVERFNPAVRTLRDIVTELDIHAVSTERLGPPLDREIDDSVVLDIMIHDLDVVLDVVDGSVEQYGAVGTEDCRYANANLRFDSGVTANLTASRVTQEKVRSLTISAADCRVKVDYLDQSIEIHRSSVPSYIHDEGTIRHRHENVVEQLTVERTEPLQNELASFVEAARTRSGPVVTGEQALSVLELTLALDEAAQQTAAGGHPVSTD
ncbi:Gfo/Idh/MocA family protein [Salinirubrum litoreum]|uniref:Gfo/Idh/MocA family oxidoreductase n=1 Tax=Salinirubrum litoreum TaxID=1126234 RepID=A0ABD5RC90_9EURY|nr:Gfo/Idh/MocA family oxidoreductase [Salinirubrum litoreum]